MPDILDLTESTGETFGFGYDSSTGDNVLIGRAFTEIATLDEVADLFKRFLLAAGFDYVTDVYVETTAGEIWSASGLQGEPLEVEAEEEIEENE